VKAQAKRLAWIWQQGDSLVSIAKKYEFPPILTSLMVLEQRKIPRKQFWKMIRDVPNVRDRRLRRELAEVVATDIVYSPVGSARQFARGRWGEKKLQSWLDARGLKYETEKDLRAKYDKTPDVLLHRPLELNGSKKYWIESKAIFGDPYEIRRHVKKQMRPYSDMFGDGTVVYWFGHVNDQEYELPEGVDIVDGDFFESPLQPYPYVPVHETPVDLASPEAGAVDLEE
jgi:hypothetical protein